MSSAPANSWEQNGKSARKRHRGATQSATCAEIIATLHHHRSPDAVVNTSDEIQYEVDHEISTKLISGNSLGS